MFDGVGGVSDWQGLRASSQPAMKRTKITIIDAEGEGGAEPEKHGPHLDSIARLRAQRWSAQQVEAAAELADERRFREETLVAATSLAGASLILDAGALGGRTLFANQRVLDDPAPNPKDPMTLALVLKPVEDLTVDDMAAEDVARMEDMAAARDTVWQAETVAEEVAEAGDLTAAEAAGMLGMVGQAEAAVEEVAVARDEAAEAALVLGMVGQVEAAVDEIVVARDEAAEVALVPGMVGQVEAALEEELVLAMMGDDAAVANKDTQEEELDLKLVNLTMTFAGRHCPTGQQPCLFWKQARVAFMDTFAPLDRTTAKERSFWAAFRIAKDENPLKDVAFWQSRAGPEFWVKTPC